MVILLLTLLLPIASSLSNFPIVHTFYGSVRGYEYQARNGFRAEIFKKIPFAAPPIGSRRWKKAEPPEKWNQTIDGTFFGPACAQGSRWKGWVTGFSEDCLTLNIYTSKQCRESNSSCPVVLYIHGGNALYDGTMMFPDETLVQNFASEGIIMVTVAYRLGVFGVMALGDERVLSANIAVHDVLEGIRFIRKEIHNFGGDKDQISVMGHSTGATIALVLAFSPAISEADDGPLFARTIAMSASGFLMSEETQVERSHRVAQKIGCKGTAQEIVDCLRPLSSDEILKAAEVDKSQFLDQLMDITITGELMHNVKELRENQKPTQLMLGTTLNEFDMKIVKQLAKSIEEDMGTTDKSNITLLNKVNWILGVKNDKECAQKYYADRASGKFDPGYSTPSQNIFMTNWLFADAQARAGGEVYLYQFDYPEHALHADDVYYVMGFHEHPKDVNEQWLSRIYPVYLANFIKGLPLAPDWKSVDPDLMNYYSINKSFADGIVPHMKFGYHRTISDYYVGVMEFDESLTKLKKELLNVPVQYKKLILGTTQSFDISNVLFYSTVMGVLLFVVFRLFQSWRSQQRNEEKSILLPYRMKQ